MDNFSHYMYLSVECFSLLLIKMPELQNKIEKKDRKKLLTKHAMNKIKEMETNVVIHERYSFKEKD